MMIQDLERPVVRKRSRRRPSRRVGLFLLALAVCLGIRVWLIHSVDIISKDGTIYVKMAQEWADDPRGVTVNYDYTVAYSAAICAVHGVLTHLGGPAGIDGWELAGKLVSLTANLLALVGLWLLAGRIFNWHVAWVTVLLFGVGRKWAMLGADVISDSPSICFMIWSLVLAMEALDALRLRKGIMLAWAAGAGALAGCAYLVRPEGLLVAAIGGLLWLAYVIARRGSWKLLLASSAVTALTALAVGLPYMLAIGGLTHKKNLTDVLLGCLSSALPLAAMTPAADKISWFEFARAWTESLQPVNALLLGLWLATWVFVRTVKRTLPPGVFLSPKPAGAALLVISVAVVAPLWMIFYHHIGYFTARHITFLSAMLSMLAGAEVVGAASGVQFLIMRSGRALSLAACVGLIAGALAAGLLVNDLRQTYKGKSYYRQVGAYLAENATAGDWVISDTTYPFYYSGRPWIPDGYVADSPWMRHFPGVMGQTVNLIKISGPGFLKIVRKLKEPATLVVLSSQEVDAADELHGRSHRDRLAPLIRQPEFELVKKFVRPGKGDESVCIYRIHPPQGQEPATIPAANPATAGEAGKGDPN